MKIVSIEDIHADGGWRNLSFLKITTDHGIIGWSEYTEAVGNDGTTACIRRMASLIIGKDPMQIEWLMSYLTARSIPVWNGIAAHARGAIANALLDVKGKALGVPVYDLFGGKVRDGIDLYWTHFAGPRIQKAEICQLPKVNSYADFEELAAEASERGFKGVKINLFEHDGEGFRQFSPGHGMPYGFPEANLPLSLKRSVARQFEAIRKGGGEDLALHVDLNYNFRLEGYIQMIKMLEPFNLSWIELDLNDPDALAQLKARSQTSLASGEALYGRRSYKPYFERYAMDVAVVDVIWNGYFESMKIASMAEVFEITTAPHNFYGPLADNISAHYAASVPNLRIMEYEVDEVPWRYEFVTHPPVITNGSFKVPDRPGWGTDIVEEAVKARPAKL